MKSLAMLFAIEIAIAIGSASLLAQSERAASNVLLRQGPTLEELVEISVSVKPIDMGLEADWLIARWEIEHGLSPSHANQLFQAKVDLKIGVKVPQWWRDEALLLLSGKQAQFYKHMPDIGTLTARRPFVKVANMMVQPPKSFFLTAKKFFGASDGIYVALVGTDAHIATDLLILQANSSKLVAVVPTAIWCPLISPGALAPALNRPIESALEIDVANSLVTIFGKSENHLFISQYDFQTHQLRKYFVDIKDTGSFLQFSEQHLKDLQSGSG